MAFIDGAVADNPERKLPMQRIFEMIARGNGEMAGQAQAKKVGADQLEANDSAKLAFTGKKSAGGVPIVKFEGPADLLNQTQEGDLEKTYATPKQNVESAIASGAQRREALTRDFGYDLPTSDVQPSSVDSFGERYRARRELGGGVINSAITAGITRGMTDEKLIRNLKNQRSSVQSAVVQKEIAPLLDQELQSEGAVLESGRLANANASERRQVLQQRLNLRNQLLDQKNTMSFDSPEEYVANSEKTMAEVGGFTEGDRELFTKAWRTNRTSFLGERVRALSGDEGKKAIESYEDTPADIQRFVDDQVGVANLSDFERNRVARVAKGLLEDKSDRERKERQSIAAEARREAREVRNVVASERAAAEAGRKNRIEERAEDREARIARQSVATPLTNRMEQVADQIRKNDVAWSKTDDPREKKALEAQNRGLLAELRDKREQLSSMVTFVDQAEYDALIAAGETAASIAADGIRVRKARK